SDGKVFDLVPAVAERYRRRKDLQTLEIWKFNRQLRAMSAGQTLRVQASTPFLLHWSRNDWQQAQETRSAPTMVGRHFADIAVSPDQRAPIRFTFFWTEPGRWEGRDYQVAIA